MRRPIVGVMGAGTVAAVLLWLVFAPTSVQAQAAELGLGEEYARAIYEVIHRESVRRQSEVMNEEPAGATIERPDS